MLVKWPAHWKASPLSLPLPCRLFLLLSSGLKQVAFWGVLFWASLIIYQQHGVTLILAWTVLTRERNWSLSEKGLFTLNHNFTVLISSTSSPQMSPSGETTGCRLPYIFASRNTNQSSPCVRLLSCYHQQCHWMPHLEASLLRADEHRQPVSQCWFHSHDWVTPSFTELHWPGSLLLPSISMEWS